MVAQKKSLGLTVPDKLANFLGKNKNDDDDFVDPFPKAHICCLHLLSSDLLVL